MTTILLHEERMDWQEKYATICGGKVITISSDSESPEVLVKSKCILMTIQGIRMVK